MTRIARYCGRCTETTTILYCEYHSYWWLKDSTTLTHMFSYQHRITESKRSRPLYGPSGGIIADDMGLGKSLTLISAIMSTLDFARSYGNPGISPYVESNSDNVGRFRSKSTLIIVPSTCWYNLTSDFVFANMNASTHGWMGGRALQVRLFNNEQVS